MEVNLLGSLEVLDDDGEPLAVAGTRLKILLVVLALRCGEVVADDHLVEALWGDAVPGRSVNALQRQVSTLRRLLGSPTFVERRGTGYVLTIDTSAIDVCRFDARAERGYDAMRDGDLVRARELLDEALRLWRGEALADVAYEQFAQAEIARLTEAKIVATEARIDADLSLGRAAGLVGELEQLVALHPLREHLRAELMVALTRSGRQADALRSYQSARAVLRDELGLEPSQELRELEAAILQQHDALARPDPPAGAPRYRSNLRNPLSSLVGRRDDLVALRSLSQVQRLVTLVGTGGVGKSRLAIEAARTLFDTGALDVWLVELADVADVDELVPTVMAALDLARAGSAPSDARRLIEFLKGRRALVILDNCEHLIAAAARLAQDLLESCPELHIWATSREGLAVPGEVLLPVAPLPLEDAITLFRERGGAADPTIDFGDRSLQAVGTLEDICVRLDGLPLAIELAAARLRAMPITELATGLADRFRVLNRGARTALPRQQTLRAVVDWSYELLFDDERRVFERLAVFGGSCTLAAARAVCADAEVTGDDAAELVSRLADKSLVIIESDELEGYARCHMLQTLVDYGRERLEASGDAARVYAAHMAYYADFSIRSGAALRGERQRGWLRAVTANLGNLRSAFDVAVNEGDAESAQSIAGGIGWYWGVTGRALQGAQWLDQARSCPGTVRDITRARLLAWTAVAHAASFMGMLQPDGGRAPDSRASSREVHDKEIDELTSESIALYRTVGVPAELAAAEMSLAVTYSARGESDRACELLADAEALLATVEPVPHVIALQSFARARRLIVEDRFDDAEPAFQVALAQLEAAEVEVHCAHALRYLGRLAVLRGDNSAAVEAIERAVIGARSLGLSGFANVLMLDLAEALGTRGELERARDAVRHRLSGARDVGFVPGVAESLAALAVLEWRAAEYERAVHLAEEALEIATSVDQMEAAGLCLAVLGFVAARRGDVDAARTYHLRGLELAQGSAEPRSPALALEGLAGVAVLEDDGAGAARLLGAAATLRRSPGRATGAVFVVTTRADVDELEGIAAKLAGAQAADAAFAEGAAAPFDVVNGVLATR